MAIMIILNVCVFGANCAIYMDLYYNYKIWVKKHSPSTWFKAWSILNLTSAILFILSWLLFIIVNKRDPGYIKPLSYKRFYEVMD